ncbi:DUF6134 family protein [Marinoscillum pacificum]|uniref:DUF6134 family protein n=1 Tax=Marinoscillum pacificum TaxID=392723 RepID=UPI002157C15E|nr:DUF6134 family protein [Marinoscillum pacificum]
MKLILTTTGFLLFVFSSITAQRLEYDVIRSDESMGTTVVNRTNTNGKVTYLLNTKTEFRVIFKFEVEYELEETFLNGTLQSGRSFNTLNGNTQKETELAIKQGFYSLIIDGIHTQVDEKEIRNSVSELYFEEPYDGKEVFSAYFGRMLTFDKIGEHLYKLVSPDGTNEYLYENGICVNVKVSRDFATFNQVLKPELLAAVRNNKYANSISK